MQQSPSVKYRPDLDGLRAIAILLVLIYHGGLSLFPSGFVGVDVFFVISGFLITGIMYQSFHEANFSFFEFYNRRLWRLQPVFICLLCVTLLLTLLFFLPEDLIQLSRSARKTSLFISNRFFSQTTTGYFSPDTHQLPLLHTWSLAIEWQCYLILPLLFYGLQGILRWSRVSLAFLVLTALTLGLSLYYSKTLPLQTYYQFLSRLFEFLIGSCLVFLPLPVDNHSTKPGLDRKIPRSSRGGSKRLNLMAVIRPGFWSSSFLGNTLGAIALFTLFFIASLDHILLGYPNRYALLVCLATGLLIALGSLYPKKLWILKVLSLRPVVFIGLLSYSLYLWHWLVFSLLNYKSIEKTASLLCIAYGVIFILAYLSWRYLEKPSRRLRPPPFAYSLFGLVLLPVLMIHAADYLIKANSGFPQRFNKELVTIYQQLNRFNSKQRPLCISHGETLGKGCQIGSRLKNSKKGLMIGDSFSNHYWGFMDTLGQSAKVSILAQATSSCLTLPGIMLYDWWTFKKQIYNECRDQTKRYYNMIEKHHYDYVILGQIWSNYLSDNVINHLGEERSIPLTKKRLEKALNEALQKIIASGARPVLVKTTALTQENSRACFFKHIKLRQTYDPSACQFPLHLSEAEQWFEALFDTMKAKYPSLILIDPKTVQCPHGLCKADIQGIPVYRDQGHITDFASYQLGSLYQKKVGQPFV